MKLLVPTNFSNELIQRFDKTAVHGLYGKLAADVAGGGRASFLLPSISCRHLQRHVDEAHKNGLEFNYPLNAVCFGNREFTIGWQRQMRKLLQWLVRSKVDSVTVSVPYLARLIRRDYPELKIHVSTFAGVDSAHKARQWEDLGVEVIFLGAVAMNRDLKAIEDIRRHVKCELGVIVNNTCIDRCLDAPHHGRGLSHASQFHNRDGYYLDYCLFHCRYQKLKDSSNFVRSTWIRPEDVHYYESIGIDFFKISGRGQDTDFIVRIVSYYTARRYDGNLLDLLTYISLRGRATGFRRILHAWRQVVQPRKISLLFLFKMYRLLRSSNLDLEAYIDNRALDGFLDFFADGRCRDRLCSECGHCQKWAAKAVRIDEDKRLRAISAYEGLLDDIVAGKPFNYF